VVASVPGTTSIWGLAQIRIDVMGFPERSLSAKVVVVSENDAVDPVVPAQHIEAVFWLAATASPTIAPTGWLGYRSTTTGWALLELHCPVWQVAVKYMPLVYFVGTTSVT
jgi:hypothetical protein